MLEQGKFWRNRVLRQHVAVVENKIAPTIVLKNCTYLNVFTKSWLEANIWIYEDRIVYVGERMPEVVDQTEFIDCTGQYVVPGYIEPHSHPYQLYNPEMLAMHAAKYGTSAFINDNLKLLSFSDTKKAFELIDDFHQLPVSMFWWARYDSQSMLRDEDNHFNTNDIISWLENPSVVQGGELTAWPQLLEGDDRLLYWLQETKRLNKRIEGHFPGASENTLTKLKLLGASADHEAITGEEVIRRLQLGYHVALRHSSIRPDLPKLLEELLKADLHAFDQLTYTTDGSSPSFLAEGVINMCIAIAIEKGVPLIDAYRMATYNVAKYYGLDDLIGSIAPGRLAHINILYAKEDPTPLSVLAKGQWIMKDGIATEFTSQIDLDKYNLTPLEIDWDLNDDDLQFSIPIGVKMVNDVILKPYPIDIDITAAELPVNNNDAFFLFLDREGKWRVNTVINGFTTSLGALCSSFSTTNDIIVIGKSKADMQIAFDRMKEIGGGIVLVHEGEVIYELPLHLSGIMSNDTMTNLIAKEFELKNILLEFGYEHIDPVFNLLFLSATHLPYIRVTPQGIVDIIKRETIVPANMR